MRRILIVDDMRDNLFLLGELLKSSGFLVSSARNGAEALEKARTAPPDLVVSDILMPVMDGYTLCREWHADQGLSQIPFMFYTATFTEKEDEELALSLGADCFLTKPQDADALIAAVNRVLSSPGGGTPSLIPASRFDEEEVLKQYSEALFNKLEKKMEDLERVNRDLAESERQFRLFIMECPVPIAVSDQQENVELVNNRFTDTFGYTLSDIPTIHDWWRLAYPDPEYREHVRLLWQASMEHMLPSNGIAHTTEEYRITCKAGMTRFVRISAARVAAKLIVVFNDITESKRNETLLRQMQGQVVHQEKMASVGMLAAGVAHEINNPMGFITSNLTTLGKYADRLDEYIAALQGSLYECEGHQGLEELDRLRQRLKVDYIMSDIRELINENLDGANRVRRIVQDLKSFSRLDQVECCHANLNDALNTTINIAWNELKYITTLERDFSDIPNVVCYPQQLNQVFLNLLLNAAQAMEKQGVITVRTWSDDQNVFVSVADTGKGMPEEVRRRVFEPFFTTKDPGKGTGLGLSISADIIRKHGGEISVRSEVGKGTTFTVRLPLNSPLPQPAS